MSPASDKDDDQHDHDHKDDDDFGLVDNAEEGGDVDEKEQEDGEDDHEHDDDDDDDDDAYYDGHDDKEGGDVQKTARQPMLSKPSHLQSKTRHRITLVMTKVVYRYLVHLSIAIFILDMFTELMKAIWSS